jgi:hypothetical protein
MSHYFRLGWDAGAGAFLATAGGGALNPPCAAWHENFISAAKALGYDVILSLSYELFDAHCPEHWKQRAEDGAPALTGWVPPSTLLSPVNGDAMAYLQAVARAFVAIARDAGAAVKFQSASRGGGSCRTGGPASTTMRRWRHSGAARCRSPMCEGRFRRDRRVCSMRRGPCWRRRPPR